MDKFFVSETFPQSSRDCLSILTWRRLYVLGQNTTVTNTKDFLLCFFFFFLRAILVWAIQVTAAFLKTYLKCNRLEMTLLWLRNWITSSNLSVFFFTPTEGNLLWFLFYMVAKCCWTLAEVLWLWKALVLKWSCFRAFFPLQLLWSSYLCLRTWDTFWWERRESSRSSKHF